VRSWREKEERRKGQEKHWELAGSRIGDLMGVKKKEDVVLEGDTDDYKASQQFSEVMREKNEAASDFAKEKTLKQQRQYLPVYCFLIFC